MHDAVVDGEGGVDYLKAAVGHAEGGFGAGAVGLGVVWLVMKSSKAAVFGDPGVGVSLCLSNWNEVVWWVEW